MTNLFSENIWGETDIFDNDKPLDETNPRTANLAALATMDPTAEDIIGEINATTEKIRNKTSERALRKQLVEEERQSQIQGFIGLQAQTENPEEQDAIVQGFRDVVERDRTAEEEYIIEKKAIERIQDLVTAGDMDQARLELNNYEVGNVMDVKRDFEVKRMTLARLMENAQIAKEDQGWFADALDFVGNELFTLKRSMGSVGNVEVKDSVKRWYDNILSGNRQLAESNALWNMSTEDFLEYVQTDLLDNLKENTTFWGIHNQTAELNILSSLQDPTNPAVVDLNDAFTNLTGVGVVTGVKVAKGTAKAGMSIPGAILRAGGRKQMADMVGRAAIDMAAEGAERGAAKNALKAEEVIDNLAPTGMSVNPPDSIVSPTARIQAYIDRAREAAAKIPELLETARFMNEDELKAAVKKQVEQLTETVGRDLVDWRMVDNPLAGGGKTFQIEATLGRVGKEVTETKAAQTTPNKINSQDSNTDWGVSTDDAKRQLLRDAGWTESEIRDWSAGSANARKMAQQAAKGWVYGKGGWAKATAKTVAAFREELQRDIDDLAAQKARIIKAQEEAPDTLTVLYGDSKPRKPSEIMPDIVKAEADLKARGERIDRIEQRMKDLEAAASQPVAAPGAGLEATVGTPTGLGFKSEAAARRSMNKLGYDQAEIFQDESGQWFGRIRVDVTEQGFYTNPLKVQVDSMAWRLLSASNVSDKNLADMARLAGNKKAAVLEQIIKPLAQRITKPKGKSRLFVEQVVLKGRNDMVWYNEDELNILAQRSLKRDLTDVELDAYNAFRELNDIEWSMRNDEVYKSKVVAGWESAEFDTPIGKINLQDARINEKLDSVGRQRIYDVETGQHFTTERPMTESELALKKGQNYVIVELREAQKMADNTYVQRFLVRRNNLSRRPLERVQVGYVPGGHRMYEGDHFVKQARRAVQGDTLKEFFLSPKTFVVGTRQEAGAWARGMEEARLFLKDKGVSTTADEIDAIFARHKGEFPSGEEFLNDMNNGKLSKDDAFEAVFDRELPSVYRELDPNAVAFAEEESGYNGWLVTTGRMYTGKKSETALVDYMGKSAPTLDPFRAADRALQNIANIMSFSDYKISSTERWSRAFKKYTDYAQRGDNMSDMEILRNAQFRPDTPNNIRSAGEAQRQIIQRNIGWKSESDLMGEQTTRRLAAFVFGDDPTSIRAKTEKIVTDWWKETNPVLALRSAAFDMKLGLLNVAQLPLQATTSIAAVSLSPKFGAQAFMLFPAFRTYLVNGNDAIVEHLIKSGWAAKSGYKDAESLRAMMRTAKQSGFFNVSATHDLVRASGPNGAMSSFGNTVDDLRETGRFFFHQAEIMNRSVAWNIAWQETRAAFPDLSVKSEEFIRKVSGQADRYSMFMTKESEAWWQRGFLSIPTQFWGYQARMLEAMFGKSFTGMQKARLIVVQSLMYGTAGLPLLPWISETIKEKHGKPVDINSFWGVADRGLLDYAMYQITGADIAYGTKIGTGAFLSNTIRDFFNAGQFGEKSMAETIGGATFGILGQSAGVMFDAFKHSVAESGADIGGDKDPESLIKLAKQISTVNNTLKAYWIFQYGTYVSTSGQVMVDGLPTTAGIATLMGFNPAELDHISTMMGFNQKQTEIVNEAAKVVSKYRVRMISEPENRQEYAKEVSAFIRRFPPDLRKRILMKTNRDFDPSLYDGLVEQVEQRTKE
jgi:hypothetical protein